MTIHMDMPLVTDAQLEAAYAVGLMRKTDLVDGQYYEGLCRNAHIARWHAGTQRFVYRRTKFGSTFCEAICHPEDERRFDVFMALYPIVLPAEQLLDEVQYEQAATGNQS